MQLDLFCERVTAPASPADGRSEPRVDGAGTVQPTTVATLAETLALYDDAVSEHPARVRIRSALRCVGRVLQQPLDALPAQPEKLRPLLAAANPVLAGVKPRQWRDVRYIVGRGLRDVGIQVISLRDETPLAPAWAQLCARLPDRRLEFGLTKFLRFCSRTGVDPSSVQQATFVTFREELERNSLHDAPQAVQRQTIKLWNKAIDSVPGWPKLPVSADTDPRRYALPWESFPGLFRDDVEAFLAAKEHGDEFSDDYAPRVRRSTTKGRRQALRRIASVLVFSGTPVEDITSLAVLCRGENPVLALRFFRDRRKGGRLSSGDINYAHLLKTIARHWVKDEPAARKIKALIAKVGPDVEGRKGGMRPKNRQRLRQFDVLDNHLALIDLPTKIFREVGRKSDGSPADSVRFMYAFMTAILLRVPMRSKNLVELTLGRNLLDLGKGKRRVVKVYLADWETKTGQEYEAPLPSHLHPMLDAWLKIHRPRICEVQNPYLFPNSRGELRSRDGVASQLTKFIKRETGLEIHMHLFRHLAAKVVLDQNPSAIETVRQFLGHTTTRTTERAYADLQAEPSFRDLDATIAGLRHGRLSQVRGRRWR